MKLPYVLIISFTILFSCINSSEDTPDNSIDDKFFVLNYEAIHENKGMAFLSDLAKDIEYVRLETNEYCLLDPKANYYFTEQYIFVDNKEHVLQFDREGNFIMKIGKYGRGPGETGLIRTLSVVEKEKMLAVHSNWANKLVYYSFDGRYIRSDSIPDVMNLLVLPGERQVLYESPGWGIEDHVFILRNKLGDTLSVVNNHYKWDSKFPYAMAVYYPLFRPFYNNGGITSLKYMYNDTVYGILSDRIIPQYKINMGKYKLPDKIRPEVTGADLDLFRENSEGYRFCVSLEIAEKFFITSREYVDSNDKLQWNMIVNRKNGNEFLVVNKQGRPGKIQNNIDGGPDFWPSGSINDSILYTSFLPHELLRNTKNWENNNCDNTNQKKKNQFFDLIKNLDESDNPVIMIVTLKRD